MTRYLALVKGSFLIGIVWRLNYVFTLVSNLVYIVVLYFLWKSIYAGATVIHGMNFNQAFVYMTVASSIFVLFKTWLEWFISRDIISGTIITRLTKPLDYQLMMFAISCGQMLNTVLIITIPSMFVLFVVFKADLPFGWNVPFFCLSLILACQLSLLIDYAVGLSSFYTESLWGISTAKEIIVLVLSGGLLPLCFFPEGIRTVLLYLPFQAVYHTPVTILTNTSLSIKDYLPMLVGQVVWVIILFAASRMLFNHAVKVVTVNGG